MNRIALPLAVALLAALTFLSCAGQAPAQAATSAAALEPNVEVSPIERLRGEIALYHQARGITDTRKRLAMLDELDARPAHREARQTLVHMLHKADVRPNLNNQNRLAQAALSWLLEVDGVSDAAVPELGELARVPQEDRAISPEMDRLLRRLAQLVEKSARGIKPPTQARVWTPRSEISTTSIRLLGMIILVAGALALGLHLGARVRPAALPHPALPAPPARAALVAASAGEEFLPLLRDALEVYVSRVHRVKNQLGIASRFEGDPAALSANLFEPESFRELTAVLARTRDELAQLASRAGSPDCPPGFSTLLSRGERVLAGALDTLSPLQSAPLSRVEEEVARLAREVRNWSTDLCAVRDAHAIEPRALVDEVVARAAYRADVVVAAPDALPPSALVRDGARARAALATALGNLLDNAHQAGARRIVVDVACDGALTVSVTDDGPGVPADLRARLFTPRFTTRADGTGMGLCGARTLLAELGGEAGHTPPSTFWLRLPALAA